MLEECFVAADDRFLVEWLRFSHPGFLARFLERWLTDPRPWARQQLIRYLQSDLMSQISSTIRPLIVAGTAGLEWGATISHIVLFLGVICGLIYFFFSREHTGIFKPASRIGIWVLMVTFGASFGYTVMARISLLTGRVQYLFRDWLGLL